MTPLQKLGCLLTKLAVIPISLIAMSLSALAQTPTVEERLAAAETAVKAATRNLSFNENKKLHLLAGRLWKRISR